MMKRMHRGGTINRIKGFNNTSMAIVVLKPKDVKSKNRFLGGNGKESSKQKERMIIAQSQKMLIDNGGKISHPVMVGQKPVKACPSAG